MSRCAFEKFRNYGEAGKNVNEKKTDVYKTDSLYNINTTIPLEFSSAIAQFGAMLP